MSDRIGAPAEEEAVAYYPLPPRHMPHLGHKKHLCHLVEDVGISMEDYKPLVKNAKFLCRKCGRTAAKEENLCEPTKL